MTPPAKALLARSLKFAPSPQSINFIDIAASVEQALQSVVRSDDSLHSSQQAEVLRDQVSAVLTQASKSRFAPNLSKTEKEALKMLARSRTMVVLRADKSNTTVVLDRAFYIDKCNAHLSNDRLYRPIRNKKGEPDMQIITLFEEAFNKRLRAMCDENKITVAFLNRCLSRGGWFSKFYAVPKLHKIHDINSKTPDEIKNALTFRPLLQPLDILHTACSVLWSPCCFRFWATTPRTRC